MTPFHREGASPRPRRSASPCPLTPAPSHPGSSAEAFHPSDPLCSTTYPRLPAQLRFPRPLQERPPPSFPPKSHKPLHPPTLSGAPLPPRPPRASPPPHSPPPSIPLRPAEGAPRMPTGHPRSGNEALQRRGPDPSVLQARAPGVPNVWILTCRLTLRARGLRLPNTGALNPSPRARVPQCCDSGRPSGLGVWGSPTSRGHSITTPRCLSPGAPQLRGPDAPRPPDRAPGSEPPTHLQGRRVSPRASPAQPALRLGFPATSFPQAAVTAAGAAEGSGPGEGTAGGRAPPGSAPSRPEAGCADPRAPRDRGAASPRKLTDTSSFLPGSVPHTLLSAGKARGLERGTR